MLYEALDVLFLKEELALLRLCLADSVDTPDRLEDAVVVLGCSHQHDAATFRMYVESECSAVVCREKDGGGTAESRRYGCRGTYRPG